MEAEKILSLVSSEIKSFYYQPNLRHVNDSELVDYATNLGIRTQHGSLAFSSHIRSSSLPFTVYVGSDSVTQKNLSLSQQRILANLPSTLEKVHHYMKKVPFVCLEKTMCNNEDFNPRCILFTSLYRKDSIRLPFLCGQSLFNLSNRPGPKLYLLCIPEWPLEERQTIVFPEIGATYILGSDCFSEMKRGFLRIAMWFAKEKKMLALWAGAKLVHIFDEKDNRIKNYGALFIGSPQTGKTIHVGDTLGLKGKGERTKVIQDEVVFVKQNRQVLGTEKVFWVRTHLLDSQIQPLFWRATLNRKTLFENVIVDHQGRLDFQDSTLTGDGRALLQIQDLIQDDENINFPPIDELDGLKIFILTKSNTVVPPVSLLNPAQAVALFILGESIESDSNGESLVRTPASNPLLIGEIEQEAEGFWNFIEYNREKIQMYLVNTGSVGKPVGPECGKKRKCRPKTIEISELSTIIRAIFKGSINWTKASHWEVSVPQTVENITMDQYKLENFYSTEEIKQLISQLRAERRKYLQRFPNLPSSIREAVI